MARPAPFILLGLVLATRLTLTAPQAPAPSAYLADLAARRASTMTLLGPDTALVLWSAPARVYSTDTNYEYRQESNLLYLSGIDQQDTALILVPGATVPSVRTRRVVYVDGVAERSDAAEHDGVAER